jgi:hypothetical protein
MSIISQPRRPSPSEQLLFQVWDRIDAERTARGEQAARILAERALAAIASPTEPTSHNAEESKHV